MRDVCRSSGAFIRHEALATRPMVPQPSLLWRPARFATCCRTSNAATPSQRRRAHRAASFPDGGRLFLVASHKGGKTCAAAVVRIRQSTQMAYAVTVQLLLFGLTSAATTVQPLGVGGVLTRGALAEMPISAADSPLMRYPPPRTRFEPVLQDAVTDFGELLLFKLEVVMTS